LIFNDLKGGRFYNEDCFDAMKEIPNGVIDMVLCDLPYGTTYAKWDSLLPLDKLWDEYFRICKNNAAIVLTASQPFTSQLVMSKPEWFRHEWIWNKINPTNFANANRGPLKQHESILVFSKEQVNYYPQKIQGKPNHSRGNRGKDYTSELNNINPDKSIDDKSGLKFPKSIIDRPKHSSEHKIHPTQKPIDLFEYFIKTYTSENEIILDNTAGSGTTAIAAINTNRKWVCIEKDKEYYDKAMERIANHAPKQ